MNERGDSQERLERLAAELESAERVLRDVVDFVKDDRHLTEQGIAWRDAFLAEVEEAEREMDAIRQEHIPDYMPD